MYPWLKLVHVIAVVLFLGNIITGVFWHKHAERTRDARLIAHTMAGVIRSDRLFTMPGVFVIDRKGIVRYAHRNKDVADNPPNDELLDAIAAIGSRGR